MRLPMALGGLLSLLVACSGEDLASEGGAGAAPGGQAGSGGQGLAGASGQAGAASGASGQGGAAGDSSTIGAGGAAGGGGLAGGGGASAGAGGEAGGTGGAGGANASGGSGQSGAGQGGGASCTPGQECVRPSGDKGLCDKNGQCQPLVSDIGCADGTREGFTSVDSFHDIAACAGAWSQPGLLDKTKCSKSGNSGPSPDGVGCYARDLCASNWHICSSADEVKARAKTSVPCDDALGKVDGAASVFYATGQSGQQEGACSDTGTNNIYGCGFNGAQASCPPLTGIVGVNKKPDYPGWSFDTSLTSQVSDSEGLHVVKASGQGGVLCCRDIK